MFGISFAELIVIAVVALAVIPTKDWPVVFKAMAQAVKFIRDLIWKITDATEAIKEQVERELPIDEIVQKTTDELTSAFATTKKTITKSVKRTTSKKTKSKK